MARPVIAQKVCDCGAPIAFRRTSTGKKMPIDVEPNPAGNVFLDGDTAVVVSRAGPPAGATLYTAHWKTCELEHRFRTPRRDLE